MLLDAEIATIESTRTRVEIALENLRSAATQLAQERTEDDLLMQQMSRIEHLLELPALSDLCSAALCRAAEELTITAIHAYLELD